MKEAIQKKEYIAAGLKLCPSGRINSYQLQKYKGRLGSRKDSTWVRVGSGPKPTVKSSKGYHSCCGSKRDYYHKVDCSKIKDLDSDDLSDLKDIC